MFDTFNMGIGYVVIVPPDATGEAIDRFGAFDLDAFPLGEVIEGTGEVLGLD
jgi:phosphoribosylformylglycinamidine cyclo-ligase